MWENNFTKLNRYIKTVGKPEKPTITIYRVYMYFLLPGYFFIPPPFLPFVSCKLRQIFELVSCRILICSINAAKNLFCCSTSPATPMPTPTPLPLPLTLSAEAAEALLLLLPLRHSGVFCPLSLESLSDGFSRQGSLKRKLQKIKKLI